MLKDLLLYLYIKNKKVMSLLDNDIKLFDETNLFKGFPNKEDCKYVSHYIPAINETVEQFYYDCDVLFLKEKWFMPYGLRIGAYKRRSRDFVIKILAIDSLRIKGGIYVDEQIAIIPYKYKNNIPNLLYKFVEKIENNIFEFVKILETSPNLDIELRRFFECRDYNFIYTF